MRRRDEISVAVSRVGADEEITNLDHYYLSYLMTNHFSGCIAYSLYMYTLTRECNSYGSRKRLDRCASVGVSCRSSVTYKMAPGDMLAIHPSYLRLKVNWSRPNSFKRVNNRCCFYAPTRTYKIFIIRYGILIWRWFFKKKRHRN